MQRLHDGLTVGGRYYLRRHLATGGMGQLWAATDEVLGRRVAVKVLHPALISEQVFQARFRDEARHAARLAHPNIATVFDYGEYDDLAFIVMELVDGPTVSTVLKQEGALPPARVRSIIGQSALGLAAAHEAGVVHRDIKPANILVTTDGMVKLTDFGISRALDAAGHTRHGEVVGTPHYLSPEQALGRGVAPASDLYSLGVVAHELLTGARPFDRGTPLATALAHVQDPPPDLPHSVPSDLREIVGLCLQKEPQDRPATARVVAAFLGFTVSSIPARYRYAQSSDVPVTPVSPAVSAPRSAADAAHVGPEFVSTQALDPVALDDEYVATSNLEEALAGLRPSLHPGEYAIVSAPRRLDGAHPLMTLSEAEGVTMLLRLDEAEQLGLTYELPLGWITLGVYRAIATLGYVPTVTSTLLQAGIPSVAMVGRWHTHLLVPHPESERALRVLTRLSALHRDD